MFSNKELDKIINKTINKKEYTKDPITGEIVPHTTMMTGFNYDLFTKEGKMYSRMNTSPNLEIISSDIYQAAWKKYAEDRAEKLKALGYDVYVNGNFVYEKK